MGFVWNDFLVLAKKLASEGDEASWRSAISRAYYAAFNQAREYVETKLGVPISDADAHTAVWKALKFSQSGRRSERYAADTLRTLRKARNHADYEILIVGDPRKGAAEAVQSSQAIIAALPLP